MFQIDILHKKYRLRPYSKKIQKPNAGVARRCNMFNENVLPNLVKIMVLESKL